MPVVTAADLRRFAPRADPHVVAAFERHGDAAFARWGLTTPARLRMFMAQVHVESAGLSVLFENMSYSAARIHAVWPSRFPSVAAAQPFARNPKALAIKVYGGRMGNRPGTEDGWLCRGHGLLDNTGLEGFTRLAAHMGVSVDDVRARLTDEVALVDCAAATFHMLGCLPFADRGDLIGCTKRVNGGLIGLADRRAAHALAGRVWPTLRPIQAASAARPAPRAIAPPFRRAAKPVLRPAAPPPKRTSWFGEVLTALTPAA